MGVIMSIADAILNQIQQAGQPRVTKQRETVTAKEPVNIGGMGLLLYMLLEMMGEGPPTEPLGGGVPISGAGELRGMENIAPSGVTSPGPVVSPSPGPASAAPPGRSYGGMDPMQLLMSILRASGSPGLRRF